MPRILTFLALGLLASCVTNDPPVPPREWTGKRTYTEYATPPTLRAELTFDGRGNVTGTIDPIGSPAPGTFVKGTVLGNTISATEQSFSNGQLLTSRNTYQLSPDGRDLVVNGTTFRKNEAP